MDRSSKVSRKEALRNIIALPAFASLALGATAIAEAKSSKAALKYQDHPNGKQKCSGCSLFIPGKTAKADGQCRVVEGAISPNGWCTAFAPKT